MTTRGIPETGSLATYERLNAEAALAAALTRYYDCVPSSEAAGDAAAILAALDGWTLVSVPGPGESAGYDREQAEIARLNAGEAHWHKRAVLAEAKIERLRAALCQIAVTPGARKLVASICDIALTPQEAGG